jgi:hypothetical protein
VAWFVERGDMIDPFVLSTIILGVWAAIGPLVGVRYGNDLSTRAQKEHWIADNKKQEYRELIEALAAHFEPVDLNYGPRGTLRSGPEARMRDTFRNRLFIARDLEKLRACERWEKAVRERDDGGDSATFKQEFLKLTEDLRDAALN